ncbi:MAG: hypothetical protein WED32_00830 [Patescibacteria group bacterium]
MLANQRFGGRHAARGQPHEQGRLQGANSSIMGLTGLVGPGLFTLTFAYFIGAGTRWHIPGASFLLAAVLMIVALAVALTINARAAARVRVVGETRS